MIRKIIKALWIFLAVIVLAIVVIFVSISKGWIGYMPPVEELENPSYKFATEIFSEDEKVLGTWSYSKENRVYTAYKDLSPSIINALIATEDVRFVKHSGIDAKALFRAFVKRGLMFRKMQVEVVLCRNSLPNSCLQKMWRETRFNVFSKNRLNG